MNLSSACTKERRRRGTEPKAAPNPPQIAQNYKRNSYSRARRRQRSAVNRSAAGEISRCLRREITRSLPIKTDPCFLLTSHPSFPLTAEQALDKRGCSAALLPAGVWEGYAYNADGIPLIPHPCPPHLARLLPGHAGGPAPVPPWFSWDPLVPRRAGPCRGWQPERSLMFSHRHIPAISKELLFPIHFPLLLEEAEMLLPKAFPGSQPTSPTPPSPGHRIQPQPAPTECSHCPQLQTLQTPPGEQRPEHLMWEEEEEGEGGGLVYFPVLSRREGATRLLVCASLGMNRSTAGR